jgi:hypothetical protein
MLLFSLSFLVITLSLSLSFFLSIYYCSSTFFETTWHESNHPSLPPSLPQSIINRHNTHTHITDYSLPYRYGIPISRNYARYFGGDLVIMSMEGYGTDSFIYLPKLSGKKGV